jgi:hypothetical protein
MNTTYIIKKRSLNRNAFGHYGYIATEQSSGERYTFTSYEVFELEQKVNSFFQSIELQRKA